MRLIFMGTPAFAVTILEALVKAGHDIVCCYTQPDRPKGRGKKLLPPPVKTFAIEQGIAVRQPTDLKDEAVREELVAWQADMAVVAAYGRILPVTLLDALPQGFLNVHASLLPAYRGAAPIQWAIRNGDRMTGISLMRMEAGMDTGAVYVSEGLPIASNETSGSLFEKCAQLGASMVVRYLPEIASGALSPVPQDETMATYAPMFDRADERIDWTLDAEHLTALNRAYLPESGTYSTLDGQRLKLMAVAPVPLGEGAPGEIIAIDKDSFTVATGKGALRVTEIQPAGKQRMTVQAFLNGRDLALGQRFE